MCDVCLYLLFVYMFMREGVEQQKAVRDVPSRAHYAIAEAASYRRAPFIKVVRTYAENNQSQI